MKALRLIVIALLMAFACTMQAQVSINVNIGARPAWGPEVESDVRYYYLPDVDVYYDIPSSMYIYLEGGRWIQRHHLPGRYRNYDLYHGRKVVVYDYRGDRPYTHCDYHTNRYKQGHNDDRIIVEQPERGYYRGDGHDERRSHEDFYRGNGRDRREGNMKFAHGRGNGHGKEKGWRD